MIPKNHIIQMEYDNLSTVSLHKCISVTYPPIQNADIQTPPEVQYDWTHKTYQSNTVHLRRYSPKDVVWEIQKNQAIFPLGFRPATRKLTLRIRLDHVPKEGNSWAWDGSTINPIERCLDTFGSILTPNIIYSQTLNLGKLLLTFLTFPFEKSTIFSPFM